MRYVVIAALVAMVALAACAGPAGTAAQGGGETAANADTGSKAAADDLRSDLTSIFSNAEKAEFSVTYDMRSDYAGEDYNGQVAMYVKGEQVRTDMTGPQGEVRSYVLAGSYVICTNDGGWQCIKFAQPQDNKTAPDVEKTYVEDEAKFWDDYGVTRLPDRTIAGANAKCYRIAAKAGEMTWDACYSREGVPLYMKTTTAEGTSTQEAKSYSSSVPASAFVPPATPQDLGDMMKQYGGGNFDPGQYQ